VSSHPQQSRIRLRAGGRRPRIRTMAPLSDRLFEFNNAALFRGYRCS
jgi:hypothetical protein